MSNYRHRRSPDRMEAAVKAGFAVLLLVAFGLGGIGGFAAVLASLVALLVFAVAFGLCCFFVLRSRLFTAKKAGLLMVLSGIFLGIVWSLVKAPDRWLKTQATVVSLTSPTYSVATTYRYEVARLPFDYANQHDWTSLGEAQKNTPTALTLYYNPENPAVASEKANVGWKRVPSILTRAVTRQNGPYQAQARGQTGFLSKAFTVRGDFLANLKAGSSFPVWSNPLNPDEFSLEPRLTVGGKRYSLLALAIAFGLAGLGAVLIKPKDWLAPRPTAVAGETQQLGTKEALRRIDWYQFEKVSGRLLETEGWVVQRRGGANPDGGADLVARRDGKLAVVQCKHWRNWEIPPKVMRELLGTKVSTGFTADTAMLFTLNGCTAEALRFAADNCITVFTADRIAAMIDAAGMNRFPEITHPESKQCPKCDAPMILRPSVRGAFWGCSRYGSHGCRGRIDG